MCQVKPLKTSWQKKLQIRQDRKNVLLHDSEIKEEKKQEKEVFFLSVLLI